MSDVREIPSRYEELRERLAVGVELIDAVRSRPVEAALQAVIENVPQPHAAPPGTGAFGSYKVGLSLPALRSHRPSRFVLTYRDLLRVPVDQSSEFTLRIFDADRRFVPRRITVPVPAKKSVTDSFVSRCQCRRRSR